MTGIALAGIALAGIGLGLALKRKPEPALLYGDLGRLAWNTCYEVPVPVYIASTNSVVTVWRQVCTYVPPVYG